MPPPAVVVVEERWPPIVAGLALASYVGVLLRLGLNAFNELQIDAEGPALVFTSLYAEAVGCLIMGIVLPHRTRLQQWCAHAALLPGLREYVPLT